MGRSFKILSIFGGLILITLVVVFSEKNQNGFHLINVTPANSSQNVTEVDPVVFTFNKPLDPEVTKTLVVLPSVLGKATVSGDTLTFKPTFAYRVDTEYTVTIQKPRAANGETTGPVTVNFTPRELNANQLTPAQHTALGENTDVLQTTHQLAGILPYDTLDYSVQFKFEPDQSLHYYITFNIYNKYPGDPDSTARYMNDLQRMNQEALDWIRSQGFDPASLTITTNPDVTTGVFNPNL